MDWKFDFDQNHLVTNQDDLYRINFMYISACTVMSTAFLKRLQILEFLHYGRSVALGFVEQLKLKTLNQQDHLMCPPLSSIMSCVYVSACLLFSIHSRLSNKWVNKWERKNEWMNQLNEEVDVMQEGGKKKNTKQSVEQKRWTINTFVRHFKSDCQTKMRSANLLLLLRQLLQV